MILVRSKFNYYAMKSVPFLQLHNRKVSGHVGMCLENKHFNAANLTKNDDRYEDIGTNLVHVSDVHNCGVSDRHVWREHCWIQGIQLDPVCCK
jgi:hypothetical protein